MGTNGGSLPLEVECIVREVVAHLDAATIGVRTQNDTGCAVANALAAVATGATQVQGTVNGYGERTGNCDNTQLIPNLTLKMGIENPSGRSPGTIDLRQPSRRRTGQHATDESAALSGSSAFAHKAGSSYRSSPGGPLCN